MTRKKVLVAVGTRPEAIKMCPLILLLKKSGALQTVVCATGQHREILDRALACFRVEPDYDLSVMRRRQTLFDVTADVLAGVRPVLEAEKPDLVLVHGDTATAYSVALAAYYLGIPIGHVEAGLRTYDLRSPFPEEFYRQSVDMLASYHFAPTARARDALVREGRSEDGIFVTGNTGIDALRYTVRGDFCDENLAWASGSRLAILTAHRRENIDRLGELFRAVRRAVDEAADVKLIFPVHPNPAVRKAAAYLADHPRIRLVEPLDAMDFHNYLARARLILTDSGGIQEEAVALGKPVLVLRDATERPEGVGAGGLTLAGTGADRVYEILRALLADAPAAARANPVGNPYGDGHASERIVAILEDRLALSHSAG